MSLFMGRDYKISKISDSIIEIYDEFRKSGLYVLGKPGMGKSTLLVRAMMDDIYSNHGFFFIDPHGDAIDDFLKYIPNNCLPECYLLNVEEEKFSFGINPLYCRDITSLNEREDTYTRAYNIFHKIWEDDWGVWLQLIIQNTLYAFIENPDYTLAEVPLFLTNENFRYQLAKNIKYNLDVREFWLARFEGKKPLDQQRQVDAALTRISTLLGHPYVKHIVGQQKSTIDFNKVLREDNVVLVKLSSALAEDIKKFVGTILISELLHAVRNRPKDNRRHFSIYVDEFQNFASSDDFATLITEARKYGIATTIAHQERFGQLGDNKKLLGATLAAANKVYFQLSVKDAQELAPELAEMSEDTAYRQGPDLVISTHPVEDIWNKGHPNSDIMEFHRKYFWIVELLKRKPDKGEYIFGPTITPPEYLSYIEKYWLKKKIPWDEFTDWETYRATPQMLEQEIALINDYCYQCAQGKFNPLEPITREELDIVYKVVELLGGVLGVRPTMTAGITSDMKNLLLRKITEWKDRTMSELKRTNRFQDFGAWDKQVFLWEIKNTNPDLLVNWTLDHIPDEFPFIFNRLEWKQRAITAGFTLNEIDNLFSWKKRKYFEDEESIFKELIRSFFKNRAQGLAVEGNHDLVLRYVRVMCSPVFFEKFRDKALNLPDDVKAAYHELLWDRNQWQTGIMCEFLYYSFFVLPVILISQPLKVPSGYYVEPLKREQTQRELIDKMAQDLSNLPRFYAWTKTLQKISKDGERVAIVEKHKIETFPLEAYDNEEKKTSPLPLEKFCKLRSEIEEEIAKRQAMWKRGLSSPSVEKKEEKQKADTSKKPPPTSFSTQVSEEKENKQKDATNDASEEGLVYQTNFYLPDERWSEELDTPYHRRFRQDGYFHVVLKEPGKWTMNWIEIPVTNFRAHVDTELIKDGGTSVYGLAFRYNEDGDRISYYLFALLPQLGVYALLFWDSKEWKFLTDYLPCEFIKNDGANSLMVEMVGQQIKLGINGHILQTLEDNSLTSGFTGMHVSKSDDSVTEVRYRNFRLYSLAGKTSKAPPTTTTS